MSRPAPLEVYIAAPEIMGASFLATLYDPANGKVLLTATGPGHDAALERLLLAKRMSFVAKRRYVVKSNRPPVVLSLLELIDKAEVTTDLDDDSDSTHVPLTIEDFITRIRNAITAIERGTKAVAA